MPITHRIEDDLLIFKARGTVAVKDFFKTWDDITARTPFQAPIDTLIDLRGAQIDVPGHEIESIVYDLKRNRLFNKIAFVAERGSFSYAMGRMFCINAEYIGCQAEIFLQMAEALDWLASQSGSDTPSREIGTTP